MSNCKQTIARTYRTPKYNEIIGTILEHTMKKIETQTQVSMWKNLRWINFNSSQLESCDVQSHIAAIHGPVRSKPRTVPYDTRNIPLSHAMRVSNFLCFRVS